MGVKCAEVSTLTPRLPGTPPRLSKYALPKFQPRDTGPRTVQNRSFSAAAATLLCVRLLLTYCPRSGPARRRRARKDAAERHQRAGDHQPLCREGEAVPARAREVHL